MIELVKDSMFAVQGQVFTVRCRDRSGSQELRLFFIRLEGSRNVVVGGWGWGSTLQVEGSDTIW